MHYTAELLSQHVTSLFGEEAYFTKHCERSVHFISGQALPGTYSLTLLYNMLLRPDHVSDRRGSGTIW
jgi:hypothetical protein